MRSSFTATSRRRGFAKDGRALPFGRSDNDRKVANIAPCAMADHEAQSGCAYAPLARFQWRKRGERMDNPVTVHDINELTVVTDESYTDFVGGLQKEISESLAAASP